MVNMDHLTFEKRLAVSLFEEDTVENAFLHTFSQLHETILGSTAYDLQEVPLPDTLMGKPSKKEHVTQFMLVHQRDCNSPPTDENIDLMDTSSFSNWLDAPTTLPSSVNSSQLPIWKNALLSRYKRRKGLCEDTSIMNQWAFPPAEMIHMAKMEATINDRIERLRRSGLWSPARLPKVMEPIRYKSHWEYVMDEVIWLAEDVRMERTWKQCVAKQLATDAVRYLRYKVQFKEALLQQEYARGMLVAHRIAAMVRDWWITARYCLEGARAALEVEQREKILQSSSSALSFGVRRSPCPSKWYRYIQDIDQYQMKIGAMETDSSDPNYLPNEEIQNWWWTDEEEMKDMTNTTDDFELSLSIESSPNEEDDMESGSFYMMDAMNELELLQTEAHMDLKLLLQRSSDVNENVVKQTSKNKVQTEERQAINMGVAEGTQEIVHLLKEEANTSIESMIDEDYFSFRERFVVADNDRDVKSNSHASADESSSDNEQRHRYPPSLSDGDAIEADLCVDGVHSNESETACLWHQRYKNLGGVVKQIRDVYRSQVSVVDFPHLVQRLQLASLQYLPLVLALSHENGLHGDFSSFPASQSALSCFISPESAWCAGSLSNLFRFQALNDSCWGPHLLLTTAENLLDWELQLKRLCPLLTVSIVTCERSPHRSIFPSANGKDYSHKFIADANIYMIAYEHVRENSLWFNSYLRQMRWKDFILDSVDVLIERREAFVFWSEYIRKNVFSEKAPILIVNNKYVMEHNITQTLCYTLRCSQEQLSSLTDRDHLSDLINFVTVSYPLYSLSELPTTEFLVLCHPTVKQKQMEENILSTDGAKAALENSRLFPLLDLIHEIRSVQQHPFLYECDGDVGAMAVKCFFDLHETSCFYQKRSLCFDSPSQLLNVWRDWKVEEDEICFGLSPITSLRIPLLRKSLGNSCNDEVHHLLPKASMIEEIMSNQEVCQSVQHYGRNHTPPFIHPRPHSLTGCSNSTGRLTNGAPLLTAHSAPESLLPSPQHEHHETWPAYSPPAKKRLRLDDDLLDFSSTVPTLVGIGGMGCHESEEPPFLSEKECRNLRLELLQTDQQFKHGILTLDHEKLLTINESASNHEQPPSPMSKDPNTPLMNNVDGSNCQYYRRSYSCTPSPQGADGSSPPMLSGRSTLADRKNRTLVKQRLQTRLRENERRWQLLLACHWSPWMIPGICTSHSLKVEQSHNQDSSSTLQDLLTSISSQFRNDYPMRSVLMNTTRAMAPPVQWNEDCPQYLDYQLSQVDDPISPQLPHISIPAHVSSHEIISHSGKFLTLRDVLHTLLLRPDVDSPTGLCHGFISYYHMNRRSNVFIVCHDEALIHLIHYAISYDPLLQSFRCILLSALDPTLSTQEQRSHRIEWINGLSISSVSNGPIIVIVSAKLAISGSCLLLLDPSSWTVIVADGCDWKPSENRRLMSRLKRWLHNKWEMSQVNRLDQVQENRQFMSLDPLLILRLFMRSSLDGSPPEFETMESELSESSLSEPYNVITTQWVHHLAASPMPTYAAHSSQRFPRKTAQSLRLQLTNPACVRLLFPNFDGIANTEKTQLFNVAEMGVHQMEEWMTIFESTTNQLALQRMTDSCKNMEDDNEKLNEEHAIVKFYSPEEEHPKKYNKFEQSSRHSSGSFSSRKSCASGYSNNKSRGINWCISNRKFAEKQSLEDKLLPVEAFALEKCALWEREEGLESGIYDGGLEAIPLAAGSCTQAEHFHIMERVWKRWETNWARQQLKAECLWRELQQGEGFPHVCYAAPDERDAIVLVNSDNGHMVEFYAPLPSDPNMLIMDTMYVDESLRYLYTGECMLEPELPSVIHHQTATYSMGHHHRGHYNHHSATRASTGGSDFHTHRHGSGFHKHKSRGSALLSDSVSATTDVVPGLKSENGSIKIKGPPSKKARLEQRGIVPTAAGSAVPGSATSPSDSTQLEEFSVLGDAVLDLQRKRSIPGKGLSGPPLKKRKGQVTGSGAGGQFKRPLDEPSGTGAHRTQPGGPSLGGVLSSKLNRFKSAAYEKAPAVFIAAVPICDSSLMRNVCIDWPKLDESTPSNTTSVPSLSKPEEDLHLVPRSFHLRSYLHFTGGTNMSSRAVISQLHQRKASLLGSTNISGAARPRAPTVSGKHQQPASSQLPNSFVETGPSFTLIECLKIRAVFHLLQLLPILSPGMSCAASTTLTGEGSTSRTSGINNSNCTPKFSSVPSSSFTQTLLSVLSGSISQHSLSTNTATGNPSSLHLPVFGIDRHSLALNFNLLELMMNKVIRNRYYRTYSSCFRQYDEMMQRGGRMPLSVSSGASTTPGAASVSASPASVKKEPLSAGPSVSIHRKGKQKVRPSTFSNFANAKRGSSDTNGQAADSQPGDNLTGSSTLPIPSTSGSDPMLDYIEHLSSILNGTATSTFAPMSGSQPPVSESGSTTQDSLSTSLPSNVTNISSTNTPSRFSTSAVSSLSSHSLSTVNVTSTSTVGSTNFLSHSGGSMAKRRSGITVASSAASAVGLSTASVSITGGTGSGSTTITSAGTTRPGVARGSLSSTSGVDDRSSSVSLHTTGSVSISQSTSVPTTHASPNIPTFLAVMEKLRSDGHLYHLQRERVLRERAYASPSTVQHHHHHHDVSPGAASVTSAALATQTQQQRRMAHHAQRLRQQQQQQQQQQMSPQHQIQGQMQGQPQSQSGNRPFVSQLQQALNVGGAPRGVPAGTGNAVLQQSGYTGRSGPVTASRSVPVVTGNVNSSSTFVPQNTLHPQLSALNVNYNSSSGPPPPTISVQYVTMQNPSHASSGQNTVHTTASSLVGFAVSSAGGITSSSSNIVTRLLHEGGSISSYTTGSSSSHPHQVRTASGSLQLRATPLHHQQTGSNVSAVQQGYIPVQHSVLTSGQTSGVSVSINRGVTMSGNTNVQASQYVLHPTSGTQLRQGFTTSGAGGLYSQTGPNSNVPRRNSSQQNLVLATPTNVTGSSPNLILSGEVYSSQSESSVANLFTSSGSHSTGPATLRLMPINATPVGSTSDGAQYGSGSQQQTNKTTGGHSIMWQSSNATALGSHHSLLATPSQSGVMTASGPSMRRTQNLVINFQGPGGTLFLQQPTLAAGSAVNVSQHQSQQQQSYTSSTTPAPQIRVINTNALHQHPSHSGGFLSSLNHPSSVRTSAISGGQLSVQQVRLTTRSQHNPSTHTMNDNSTDDR